jgi:hypothetical protein
MLTVMQFCGNMKIDNKNRLDMETIILTLTALYFISNIIWPNWNIHREDGWNDSRDFYVFGFILFIIAVIVLI